MQFDLSNIYEIKNYLNSLHLQGVKIIEIKEVKENRSLNANALYWEWLNVIAKEIGDDVESLHYAFKGKFLGWKIIETKFSKSKIPKSSRKLNVREFYNYMLQIEVFAKEFLNIDKLPQPTKSILKALEKFDKSVI